MLVAYTDGSTRKNGSPDSTGGFGVCVFDGDKIVNTYAEQHHGVTNNQMEMMAILWTIVTYHDEVANGDMIIYSDSRYAVNTFADWMWNWKNNNWTRKGGKPVENLTLVKFYDIITDSGKLPVQLRYIKGHNGILGNEIADALATGTRKPETTKGEKINFEL